MSTGSLVNQVWSWDQFSPFSSYLRPCSLSALQSLAQSHYFDPSHWMAVDWPGFLEHPVYQQKLIMKNSAGGKNDGYLVGSYTSPPLRISVTPLHKGLWFVMVTQRLYKVTSPLLKLGMRSRWTFLYWDKHCTYFPKERLKWFNFWTENSATGILFMLNEPRSFGYWTEFILFPSKHTLLHKYVLNGYVTFHQ